MERLHFLQKIEFLFKIHSVCGLLGPDKWAKRRWLGNSSNDGRRIRFKIKYTEIHHELQNQSLFR